MEMKMCMVEIVSSEATKMTKMAERSLELKKISRK
jgi:hypothetical protein